MRPDIEAIAEQVFVALADPSRRGILAALAQGGRPARLGADFTSGSMAPHPGPLRVTEYAPGRRAAWLVLENCFVFTDGAEWLGPTIEIDIAEQDGKTEVCLTHRGLLPQHD